MTTLVGWLIEARPERGLLAGLLAGGQVGGGMAPPDPRASERPTAVLKETGFRVLTRDAQRGAVL
jgi:hypothetical protein